MAWTLENIITLVRDLTARPSTNQVSDAVLTTYINDYYQIVLPFEVDAPDLKGWFTQALTHADGEYSVPDTVHILRNPMTIDDGDGDAVGEIKFTQDEIDFKSRWPDDTSRAEGVPQEVLLYNGTLYFMPIPDDAATYTFKCAKIIKPTALSTGASPLQDEWGRLIAYGAAITYLADHNQATKAAEHTAMYSSVLTILNRPYAMQKIAHARIKPEF